MINFIKGIIVGVGNITPGLSGSALLIVFGLYENSLEAISNIFKSFKKSFKYLLPIGLGIIVGTILFSNVIELFITKYEVITKLIFVFFVLGTIPSLFKQANKKGFKITYIIPFIITFTLGVLLLFSNVEGAVNLNTTGFTKVITLFLTGILVAASTFIPGISSTVLLTMLGLYSTYLGAIAHLQITVLIPIVLGVAFGGFFLSKMINHLLKKHYSYTFYAILGFVVSTVPALIPKSIVLDSNLLIGIALGLVAFTLTYIIEKRA